MRSVSIPRLKVVLLLWLGLLSVGVMAPLQAAEEKPEQVINASYLSIQKLINDQVLVAGMQEQKLLDLMELELGPVIDFERISRKVMGKYARQASDAQLLDFNQVFKRTLVNTYSKGLDRLDELDTFEVGSADYDARGIRASVGSSIVLKGGERYQVQYSLFLNEQSQWKVENLVVEGINIGLVFRNQFAHYMEQYDDISKVIANWGVTKVEGEG
ncbi:MAG: phospholipid transport system substrate-binding protein [Motiliproteus sp.]|jgi:phospholipid transport system substrate-binding protein